MAQRPRPVIEPIAEDARLDEPIYAVNLLDRIRPWAYDFYNLLAYPAARRVGARVLLKGVDGKLAGGDGEVRETILIVGYKDAVSFLRMATNPYFLAVSAMRKFGLGTFEFGFTRRLDGGPSHPPSNKSGVLLALFWPPGEEVDLGELRKRVSAAGSTLVFSGSTKARMALRRGEDGEPRPTKLAPPLPHGHVVIVTGHERTLTPLAEDLPPGATFGALYRRVL